jgi:hypothetical protein
MWMWKGLIWLRKCFTHKLLAYDHDVNTVGENTDTTKKSREALLHASKELGLEN